MNILFVTSSRIGDAVLTTGVLGKLLDENPQAKVMLACGPLVVGPRCSVAALRNVSDIRVSLIGPVHRRAL